MQKTDPIPKLLFGRGTPSQTIMKSSHMSKPQQYPPKTPASDNQNTSLKLDTCTPEEGAQASQSPPARSSRPNSSTLQNQSLNTDTMCHFQASQPLPARAAAIAVPLTRKIRTLSQFQAASHPLPAAAAVPLPPQPPPGASVCAGTPPNASSPPVHSPRLISQLIVMSAQRT